MILAVRAKCLLKAGGNISSAHLSRLLHIEIMPADGMCYVYTVISNTAVEND
jgi:hypothetical protein